jgi:formylglycine-generating enzyme required for sulfatase activity
MPQMMTALFRDPIVRHACGHTVPKTLAHCLLASLTTAVLAATAARAGDLGPERRTARAAEGATPTAVRPSAADRRYGLRLAVPGRADLADALTIVREAFKRDLERVDTPLDGMLEAMLATVQQTEDSARKYAVLLTVEQAAVTRGAYRAAVAMTAERTALFELDPIAARLELLRRIEHDDERLTEEYLDLALQAARDAVDADAFKEADEAVSLADRAVRSIAMERKARGPQEPAAAAQGPAAAQDHGGTDARQLFERVVAVRKFVREERKLATQYLKSRKRLQEDPDDAVAATVVGRHLCFVKEAWLEGLRTLSRCDDAILREAATEEIALLDAAALDPRGALAVAGTWWKVAADSQIVPAAHADRVRKHAAAIYLRIRGDLQDPVDVALATTRVAEIDAVRAGDAAADADAHLRDRSPPLGEPWGAARWPGDTVTNSLGMRFVLVPAGAFTMGSPADEAGRGPDEDEVQVIISRPFLIGQTEVTQEQWRALMETEPWRDRPNVLVIDAHPATYISWEAARDFCKRLTAREREAGRIPDTVSYTLPTEAQWEYACRAGSTGCYSFGENENLLPDHSWSDGFGGQHSLRSARPVGQKAGNRYNVFDMHGNAWEWCLDGYARQLPGGTDPLVSTAAADRVVRGGSWNWGPWECRSANRQPMPRDKADFFDGGFRVVRTLDPADIRTEGRTASRIADRDSSPAG